LGYGSCKQLCKTHAHCIGLDQQNEAIELKQVLLAISRVRPNNNVATKDDKTTDTDCRNNCFGKVSHYRAIGVYS